LLQTSSMTFDFIYGWRVIAHIVTPYLCERLSDR
jgi:hypothetical protein